MTRHIPYPADRIHPTLLHMAWGPVLAAIEKWADDAGYELCIWPDATGTYDTLGIDGPVPDIER